MCASFSPEVGQAGAVKRLNLFTPDCKGFCCCTKRRVWVLQSLSAARSRRTCLQVGLAAATAVSQNLPAVFLARRLPFLEVGGNSENVIEGNNDLLLLKPRCLFPTSASVGVAPCRHLRLGKRRRVEGRGGVGRKTRGKAEREAGRVWRGRWVVVGGRSQIPDPAPAVVTALIPCQSFTCTVSIEPPAFPVVGSWRCRDSLGWRSPALCLTGENLVHTATGAVECSSSRPQSPAQAGRFLSLDCTETASLLCVSASLLCW